MNDKHFDLEFWDNKRKTVLDKTRRMGEYLHADMIGETGSIMTSASKLVAEQKISLNSYFVQTHFYVSKGK